MFLILAALFLLTNCKSGNVIKFGDTNYQQNEREKAILKKKNSSPIIFFEDNFRNDRVKIYIDKKLVFNQEITTGEVLGVASNYLVKNKFNKISIQTNYTKITLTKKEINDFKNIYVNKLPNNKLEILITNKIHFYK